MIQYFTRKTLNIEKYDACIKNANNTRIYAFSWYLDIVSDNWDALVLDDYKAVMPLPWRSKYFIKYIYIPCWTQQLGVFSSGKINDKLIMRFIHKIPKKFKKITINFNTENKLIDKNSTEKVNYILPLNKPYDVLFKNYRSIRKRVKKKLHFFKTDVNDYKNLIQLFKKEKKGKVSISELDYQKLAVLINYLNKKNSVEILLVKDDEEQLLGGAFFLKDAKRITYLFSAVSKQGRKKQIMTLVIDTIINKYANTNYTLDFEGSMIEGIAFFFKSFGAIEEKYYLYQSNVIT